MLYMIEGAQAEDDSSGWKYLPRGSGFSRVQMRPLSVTLPVDGQRAFSIGTDIVVDIALAHELEQIAPELRSVA